MGGRGSFSASGRMQGGSKSNDPLNAYAVASLNKGIASGTTREQATARFREQLMNERYEYSAYIDNNGYIHSLGSVGKEGSTKVAPMSTIAKEKNVSTVIHNHPHGGSDGRKWGGPLSEADLSYITSAYNVSGGKINTMIATAREGTYSARVTKRVANKQFKNAIKKAEASLSGKKYQSEGGMWKAINKAYTSEFAKIGVIISFTKQTKANSKLVTQKIGTY